MYWPGLLNAGAPFSQLASAIARQSVCVHARPLRQKFLAPAPSVGAKLRNASQSRK
ncbi:hypothetical protein CSC12_5780 [Klebsiella michiganensis]|nr:hypothetical protein A225_2117 [Klebsiella michiganensis E718]AWF55790.1 hypothetical protein CSC12_5780 [Klebsiella michiganensis]